jgi:hypothetical protein
MQNSDEVQLIDVMATARSKSAPGDQVLLVPL